MRRALLILAALLLGVAAAAVPAAAETCPSRQIRLVVPFAPGEPADFLARLVSQELGGELASKYPVDDKASTVSD